MNLKQIKSLKNSSERIFKQTIIKPDGSTDKTNELKYILSVNEKLSNSQKICLDLKLVFYDNNINIISLINNDDKKIELQIDSLDFLNNIEFIETNLLINDLSNDVFAFELMLENFIIDKIETDDYDNNILNIFLEKEDNPYEKDEI